MLSLYTNMLVLVTGGAGFIGSTIVEQLVQQGAHVRVLDNLSTGSRENIAHLMDRIEFIEGDITDYQTCLKAAKDVHVIFHLAAQISVPGSVENPTHCYTTNINGLINILEASRANKVRRVVFSSSSAVYGAQGGVFNEETTTTDPQSPYGMSKLMGEMLCNQWYNLYGLETVSMRYFNVFGERQNPNAQYAAAVAKFKANMRENKPLVFFGDGLQTRDYVPVETVALANLTLGIMPAQRVCGQIFNVATGRSINLFELAEELKKEFPNYTGGIEFRPERAGDVKHTKADCSKLLALLEEAQRMAPSSIESTKISTAAVA